jgi:hypothetical protein
MIHGSRRRFMAASLVAVAGLAACSDATTSPSAVTAVARNAGANGSNGPTLHSNSVRYRSQTTSFHSNRSGSATLTTRALMAKNGATTLEVTTGALDAASAPGNISKLQVKFLTTGGVATATQNFNGLTGPVQTRSFNGLARHSSIQVQGNVRDIDPKRTDVVTVTERVNLRPDLAVLSINAPDRVKPNTDIIVTATVGEINEDVGATANCILSVNGTENRRIEGMWVADGDQVNCAFHTSLSQTGTYTLSVAATNVSPADWDNTNNSASRTIEVVNPEVTLHGYAYAQDYDNQYSYSQHENWGYNDPYYSYYSYRYERDYHYNEKSQYSYIYGYDYTGIQGAISNVRFTQTSNGNPIASLTSNVPQQGCSFTSSPDGGDYAQICSYGYFQAGHNAGNATYYDRCFSDGYYYYWGCGYYYSTSWENSWTNQWGTYTQYGSEVTSELTFEDAAGTLFRAFASVPLTGSDNYEYGPYSSESSYNDGWYFSNYSYSEYRKQVQRWGGVGF